MSKQSSESGAAGSGNVRPVLLMVSGGSDSEALLEMAAEGRFDGVFGQAAYFALHVNHQLRGAAADADEAFVVQRCAQLGIPCTVRRVDIAGLAAGAPGGVEAVAREERYRLADAELDRICCELGVDAEQGIICTAHTLDDRIETFFMRTLVGTGPAGLRSIPRERGRIRRPLLDAGREELREWLRERHLGQPDDALWREDATNDDGSNFRSRVRHELLPVLRNLRAGFERPLARTMDLMGEEDQMLQDMALRELYLGLEWDGSCATFPVKALARQPRPLARRMLRALLLVVEPDARLEAGQIERVLDNLGAGRYATEVSGGVRVNIGDGLIACRKAQ